MINTSEDRFRRIRNLIGTEQLDKLHQSFVCIVGLGAVGSYATEALCRSGVGRLRLVDYDTIHPTNFNRQLYALESTLGHPKAVVAQHRIQDIHPTCQTEALSVFVHEDTLLKVLAGPPDLVIDAIDSLNPKVALLSGCQEQKIPVLSCMGAALRRDPSQIRTGSLKKTHGCPLARKLRQRLRRRGYPLNIPCVYSTEPTHHLPPTAIKEDADSEDTLQRGRPRRSLGSLPTLTGIFGLTLANMAINTLLDR